MKYLTPKDIGKKFEKSAREVNSVLNEISFIEKAKNIGWIVTKKGMENGGIQKKYLGNNYVCWESGILENQLFLKNIQPETDISDSEEIDFRKKFEAKYRTKSGHYVRSRAEAMIADWLYGEYLAFAYEKLVPIEEDIYCDFFIPIKKIYIEFWGMEEDDKYLKRKNKKLEIYKKYNLNLIEIDNNTINNLDDFLPKELLKFGVKF
ncbi:hypothetical protein CBLAS_0977 [Campylobacter blaseri]|nr:hypothetical protein [Campylobacter blaseri]QKF86162.1 hypothetical protein CBLAS_0977 [Campylobacter blaseri]